MFSRYARFSRLRDERIARLYSNTLLLRILFIILKVSWISNSTFKFMVVDFFSVFGYNPTVVDTSGVKRYLDEKVKQ